MELSYEMAYRRKTTVHPIGKQWRYIYETKKLWNSGKPNKSVNIYWYFYQSLLQLGNIMEGVPPDDIIGESQ